MGQSKQFKINIFVSNFFFFERHVTISVQKTKLEINGQSRGSCNKLTYGTPGPKLCLEKIALTTKYLVLSQTLTRILFWWFTFPAMFLFMLCTLFSHNISLLFTGDLVMAHPMGNSLRFTLEHQHAIMIVTTTRHNHVIRSYSRFPLHRGQCTLVAMTSIAISEMGERPNLYLRCIEGALCERHLHMRMVFINEC